MESSNNITTTALYNSDEGDFRLLDKQIVKRKGRPRKLANFDEDSESLKVPKKLMHSAKENYSYKQLVQSLEFLQNDKKELAQQIVNAYYQQADAKVENSDRIKNSESYQRNCFCCKDIDSQTKASIVLYAKYYRWSYGSIAAKLRVPVHSIRCIVRNYLRLLKLQAQVNKINAPKMRCILNEAQICWLSDYLDRNNSKRIVAKQIKHAIEQQFPEVWGISLSTVTRLLKQRFCLSYKKLSKRNIASERKANLVKFVELVYFDGFGWDSRRSTFYGWGKRGEKTCIKLYNEQMDMSFICAISALKFYGVMGVKGVTTGQCTINFLEKVCECRNKNTKLSKKRFVFICDNASVNVCSDVSDFISRSGLRLLTIPPYMPAMNPAEKVISCIKSKLKLMQCENKLLCTRSIKEAVDETCKVDPAGFVNASNIETAKELKYFIESF